MSYLIRFRDVNCFDDIKNYLGAIETCEPLSIIHLVDEVELINIEGRCYRRSFVEYVPAIEEGAVNCVDVFLSEC